jgi:uncharacterized coiled-coil DUF342 family protein
MESGLESFALLEKKTLALGRLYKELMVERNNLQQQVEAQAQKLNELETKVGSQEELLSAVDAKMVDLLEQIDTFLPQESQNSGDIQVLPGMHGS